MKDIHSGVLYEAATNSLVSEASGNNTWTKMVLAAQDGVMKGETVSAFKADLKAVEKLIKKEHVLSHMPSNWRSAKSLVLRALVTEGISLFTDNGEVKGKVAVQNDLKTAKDAASTSPEEAARHLICRAVKIYHGLSSPEQLSFLVYLKSVLPC